MSGPSPAGDGSAAVGSAGATHRRVDPEPPARGAERVPASREAPIAPRGSPRRAGSAPSAARDRPIRVGAPAPAGYSVATIPTPCQRRLGRRDYLLLSVVCLALIVLAIQLPFGTRGFDRPQQGAHWRALEAPGRLLGWGGVAVLLIGIPYALVAWLKGRAPGRAVSALGAVVFGIGIGGLSGVLASTPIRGGGIAGGALAHMLEDSLGPVFAGTVLAAIVIPGLFLSLAPLLLETGYVVKAAGSPARAPASAAMTSPLKAGAGRGAPLPPVLVKPWYPERQLGEDGEELPMSLGGTDVGPIRYRDPPPESTTSAAAVAAPLTPPPPPSPATQKAAIPKAMPPPSPPPRKSQVISGVRYVDEAPIPAAPLTREPHEPGPDADRRLPAGVRFAPSAPPAPEPVVAPEAAAAAEPALATPPAETLVEAPRTGSPAARDRDVVEAWVAANPLPSPQALPLPEALLPESVPVPDALPGSDSGAVEGGPSVQHPSVAGHRRKLAESGIFEGTSPAADRPGRPPKPKPRPAAAKDWREALHGLFSSLPVEELPPIRVPDDLVGRSAEEEAALRVDAPGQLKLFDASETTPDGRAAGTRDALFDASVDAALERGTASLVLLKRRLGVGYARAASLMDALVAEGVLGEMTASGSRPTLLTQAEWNRRRAR